MDSGSTVVSIHSLRGKDTIALCEKIIDSVRDGSCSGIMFAVRRNGGHQWGITGEYKKHPVEVAMIAGAFLKKYGAKSRTSVVHKIGTLCMMLACVGMATPLLNTEGTDPHKALYELMSPNTALRMVEKELPSLSLTVKRT